MILKMHLNQTTVKGIKESTYNPNPVGETLVTLPNIFLIRKVVAGYSRFRFKFLFGH